MQKYWKSTVLVLVIIAAVTTYYVQSAKLSGGFPQLAFKQVAGDSEAAEPITMEGGLQYSMADSESFKVTEEDGTTYMKDESFTRRLQGFYKSEAYKQRKKEYRSFMRGKVDDDVLYDEDAHHVAYAEVNYGGIINEASLNVDVLDKDSGDRTQMEVPFEQSTNAYMMVAALKMMGDQLIVIVDNDSEQEVFKYTVDLKEEQVSEKEKLYTAEDDRFDRTSFMSYLFNEDHSGEDMMIVEEQTIYKQEENGETAETNINHTTVYDLETNEAKDIELPENRGMPVGYDDTAIYLSEIDGKELTLSTYDREEKEVTEELPIAIETTPEMEVEADTQHVMRDGKLYISILYHGLAIDPEIVVIDLSTMGLAYKGEIILAQKRKLSEKMEQEFYFNEMGITTRDES